MSFWNKLFKARSDHVKNNSDEEVTVFSFDRLMERIRGKSVGNDLSEISYFICMKVLSESMGKLSLHLKSGDNQKVPDHESLYILKTRPNAFMTPSTFKTLMEFNRNHYGNAYAYIEHDKHGYLQGLYPLDPLNVRILVDNVNLFEGRKIIYEYLDRATGKTTRFAGEDILHLKGGLSADGIVGMCVRETLARTLAGSKKSQEYLNDLYEKGLTAKAILKYTGDFNKEKRRELTKQILSDVNESKSGLAVIPMGFDLIPFDLKMTDSQFYELKKYTSLQIAAAFGIKPNHLNNYEKSSYANSEMQNLTFYIDTLLYILTLYEEEFNYKLLSKDEIKKGYHFEFNVGTILRGDLKAQAESLNKYVTGGIYTINEARKYAGLPATENGDVIVMNGSYVPLEKLGTAYDQKGGDDSGEYEISHDQEPDSE